MENEALTLVVEPLVSLGGGVINSKSEGFILHEMEASGFKLLESCGISEIVLLSDEEGLSAALRLVFVLLSGNLFGSGAGDVVWLTDNVVSSVADCAEGEDSSCDRNNFKEDHLFVCNV